MSLSIEDFVCCLIAGRTSISKLYYNVDLARNQRSKGLSFCYKATFPGVGNKMYKAYDLLRLDNLASCTSIDKAFAELGNQRPSMDQFVLILLIIKNELLKLYQTRYRALYIRSQGKIFCYTFVNPLGNNISLNKNRLTFKDATKFLNFFCQCEKKPFDPINDMGM